jgi:pimeloyl-ACP methyl ester carboxylesterase
MSRNLRVHTVRLTTGVSLAYELHGNPSRVPVVLVHPWGESRGCFEELLPELPATMRTLAVDQRGHGEAEKPEVGYTMADFALDIQAFMDAVGIGSAILLGSSSGGYVAQQVALDVPHRVTGLVLVGSPRSLWGRSEFADQVDGLTDPVKRAWVERSVDWFPRFHDVPDRYIQNRVNDGLRVPARVWRQGLAGLTTAQPPTERGTIVAPTLIIWGANDQLLPFEDQQALAGAIPGSRLVIYEGTGHLVLWEQPRRVASDLARFVESLSS